MKHVHFAKQARFAKRVRYMNCEAVYLLEYLSFDCPDYSDYSDCSDCSLEDPDLYASAETQNLRFWHSWLSNNRVVKTFPSTQKITIKTVLQHDLIYHPKEVVSQAKYSRLA